MLNAFEKQVRDAAGQSSEKNIEDRAAESGIEVNDEEILIIHPAFDVSDSFISLGYRETCVVDNKPKDKNLYILSSRENTILHEEDVCQLASGIKIIYDLRERVLINIKDKWSKRAVREFVLHPECPMETYYEIKNILHQYVEFQREAQYGLVTAWIMATYFHRLFHAFPFLYPYGRKQTGKSRFLDILDRLCFNSLKVKGISIPALADSVDGVRGTFLMDQAELLNDRKNVELLGILADSYTVGGGKRRIINLTNKTRRVMEFETYSPKVFASTKEIDPDLRDRCIMIPMVRACREYPYPEAHLLIWGEIRDKLYRLLLTRWHDVQGIYNYSGRGMVQRVRELWKPLDTILDLEQVPQDERNAIRTVFLESMLETQNELSDFEEALFTSIFNILDGRESAEMCISEIASLIEKGDMSQRGLETWVGRSLTRLNLYEKKLPKREGRRPYLISLAKVKDIYSRYTQSSSFSSEVVNTEDNQDYISEPLKNMENGLVVEVVEVVDEIASARQI